MKFKLPRIKLSLKQNIIIMIVSGLILGMMLMALFGGGLMLAIEGYGGGWEVKTRLDEVYIGSQNKWYDAYSAPVGKVPWGPKTVQFDPSIRTDEPLWEYITEPDMWISVDDPIHTSEDSNHHLFKNEAGTKVISAPLDEYIREIPRQVGTEKRFYYHHAYAYAVTVKTVCDTKDAGGLYQAYIESKGEEGTALIFTVRTRFSIDPWQILGDIHTDPDTGETYSISTAWAGVMSASYEIVEAGFTDRAMQSIYEIDGRAAVLATVVTGWEWTKPQVFDSCNMYTIAGVPANNEVPINPQYIEGIPREVLIDVSGMLFAGTKQGWLVYPMPYNLYMQFTIRVDVLTCAGFTPVSGTNPLPDPPDDINEGPVPFLYPLAYALGVWYGQNWWMIALVLLVILGVLGLVFSSRIMLIVRMFTTG